LRVSAVRVGGSSFVVGSGDGGSGVIGC